MTSRERLVTAMSDLMWERGFGATTPREVRELAEVGQGSMYHHFPTKKDLGIAAIEDFSQKLSKRSIGILEAEGNPLDRLRAYLNVSREPVKGCRIGRLTQDPAVAHDPELLAPVSRSFASTHRALTNTIQEAINSGLLRSDLKAEQWARLFSTTIQGGYVLSIANGNRAPFDEAITALQQLLDLETTNQANTTSADRPV